LSLSTDTLEEIWNSEYLREVRRGMLRGERISACEHCYRMEESGGTSLRQIANRAASESIGEMARRVVEENAALADPPSSLHLWLGNLCNLKCRMCSPIYSSQIAADEAHSSWMGRLRTEAILLPELLAGVSYHGVGELRTSGSALGRQVAVGRDVTISLPGNGDAIARVEIAGTRSGSDPMTLTITADDQVLAREALAGEVWQLAVELCPLRPTAKPLSLHLRFDGGPEDVAVRLLRLVCEAPVRKKYPTELASRFPDDLPWAQNRELLLGEIFARPDLLGHLDFAGGEPMLNPHLPAILEMLVDSGHANHITASFSTNATVHSSELVELLRCFEHVDLWLSIDGVGPLQEYIRPPARWETVWRNVERYSEEPFNLAIHATPQAYNLFGLLDLARLCDRHGFALVLNNVLHWPRWLSLDMLPQSIVDEGRQEWESYLADECRPEQASEVETLVAYLKRPRSEDQTELLAQFVRFTTELDRSRGQSLASAAPLLHARLRDLGVAFEAAASQPTPAST